MKERLGTVVTTSGLVLVYDVGNMGWWRRFDRSLRDEPCVDLAFVGPTATLAAERWGTPTGRIHDVPAPASESSIAEIGKRLREMGVKAQLESVPTLPPRERARAMVAERRGASGIFGGLDGAVVRDVPIGKPLDVIGLRRDDGRWERVSLVCADGTLARSEKIGFVSVDWARLCFADPAVLDLWEHERSLDGKADFVFWGRDAAAVAKQFGAPKTDEGWGWLDLPVADVIARGGPIEDWRVAHAETKYATDFRPHSHHFELMRQIRATKTGSGTVELGAGRVCGFHTSWGDGAFDVWCDWDEPGRLLAIHVELAPRE